MSSATVPSWVFITTLLMGVGACTPAPPRTQTLRHIFEKEGFTGTIVIYDAPAKRWFIHNKARAAQRFLPASTFKLPNSLIALENNVISESTVLRWDGTKRFYGKWNQDMTISHALRYSAVWFYQELARRIGPDRMQKALKSISYGNADISGGIDRFWLDGGLRISALEQVAFLRALHDGKLPFSQKTLGIVRRLMIRKRGTGYTVHAKTGWAVRPKIQTGWYVGWVSRPKGPCYFATNIETRRKSSSFAGARIRITMDALRLLRIIPSR